MVAYLAALWAVHSVAPKVGLLVVWMVEPRVVRLVAQKAVPKAVS